MSRISRTKLGIAAALFAAAVITGALVPVETAAQSCFCVGPVRQSPEAQGWGATCTAAYDEAQNNATSLAVDDCVNQGGTGACLVDFVVTSECTLDNGTWYIDGYVTYKCRQCF